MKVVLWQAPDSSIRVTIPARPSLEGETDDMHADGVALRALAADPSLQQCTRLPNVNRWDLPQSRRFRNHWRLIGGQVRPAVPLVRAQVLGEVLRQHKERLLASDSERARLEDIGTVEQRQALANYRRQLREMVATVRTELDALETVEQLDGYTPSWPSPPT